jgi:hypothetical protein
MQMNGNNSTAFNDISNHWAEEDILYAAQIGWVSGYPDKSFKPDQPITRAEFITLTNNVLKRVPETIDDILYDDMIIWSDNAKEDVWYYLAVQEATNSHIYAYKIGQIIPGKQFEYEYWVEIKQPLDWIQMEKQWISRYSSR